MHLIDVKFREKQLVIGLMFRAIFHLGRSWAAGIGPRNRIFYKFGEYAIMPAKFGRIPSTIHTKFSEFMGRRPIRC